MDNDFLTLVKKLLDKGNRAFYEAGKVDPEWKEFNEGKGTGLFLAAAIVSEHFGCDLTPYHPTISQESAKNH